MLQTFDPLYFRHLIISSLIESQTTTGRNAAFFKALAFNKELGATRGIDATLKAHRLDALVLPATGWTTTPAGMSQASGRKVRL